MEKTEFKTATGEVYATVEFDTVLKCWKDRWRGFFGPQEHFRKVLLTVLEKFLERRSTRLLTDVSQMLGSFDSSRDWIQEEITSKLIKNGLRYHAMVIPNNIFSKLSLNDYTRKMEGLEIRLFFREEDARQWLLSTPEE